MENYSQIIPLYRNDMEDFSYLRRRLEIKSFSEKLYDYGFTINLGMCYALCDDGMCSGVVK